MRITIKPGRECQEVPATMYSNKVILILLILIFVTGSVFSGCARKKPVEKEVFGTEQEVISRSDISHPTDVSAPVDMTIKTIEDVRVALDQGDLNIERAWEILNPLLEKNPGDTYLLMLKSRLLWQMNKFDESLDVLDDILDREPTNTEALALKTRLLMDRFRNKEALETAEYLVDVAPNRPGYKLLKARVLIQNRKYEKAEDLLLSIIESDPDNMRGYNIEAYLSLMDVYDESMNPDEGLEFIRRALKKDWPDPADKSIVITRLGELLERQGKGKEAIRCFEEAIKLDPNNTGARSKLALSVVAPSDPLKVRDKPVDLRRKVEKSIDEEKHRNDDDFNQLFALAQLNISDGRKSVGKAYLYRALEKYPLEITGYNSLGYYTLYFKEYRESQMAYLRAKARRPGDYDALMGEALLAMVRRDFEAANKILSSLHVPEHRKAEHYRRIGDLYLFHLKDYEKARKNYHRTLKYLGQGEDPVMSLVNLGNIELRYGNDEKAEKYFRRSLSENPGRTDIDINEPIQGHKFDINIIAAVVRSAIQNHRYEMAKKYINEWKAVNPVLAPLDSSRFYLKCAHNYLSNGDIDEAVEMVKMAKDAVPDDPMIYNEVGKVLLVRGDKAGAEKNFKKSVKADPEEAFSWFYLGFLAEEKGNNKKAKSCYDKAKKGLRSPGDIDYHKAWIYSVMRSKKSAVRFLREACKKDIFNACRAYSDDVFNWMRDDEFFKEELPGLLKHVKDKTRPPPVEDFKW
ncbi:MAG: tetratricopeptide repeat protein [Candidatus Eremiobacteraeota bacterium]|nr:tetratricopeptide repeat protein [Candidatus Eremiobacteraeota bacterium]